MGTKTTRAEKINFIKTKLAKSKENKKGWPKKQLVAQLMINFYCEKLTASEIVQSFIDAKEAEEVEENGELFVYG